MNQQQWYSWVRQRLWRSPQYSRPYRQWRREFVRDRLTLAIWIAIFAQILLELIHTLLVHPLENWAEASGFRLNWAAAASEFQILGISILCLLVGLVILRRSRRHPIRLLPWFSLSLLVLPESFHWLTGSRTVDGGLVGDMAIVFWCQTILVPVQWRMHLLSHLMVSLGLIALGIRDWLPKIAETSPATVLLWASWVMVYSGLIIAIANILVGYAERMLWKAFSLREQLQQFLQTVSQDLRSPIQQSQTLLQQHKAEISLGPNTTLTPVTVEQLLNHSQQQLDLLNALLESARSESARPETAETLHD